MMATATATKATTMRSVSTSSSSSSCDNDNEDQQQQMNVAAPIAVVETSFTNSFHKNNGDIHDDDDASLSSLSSNEDEPEAPSSSSPKPPSSPEAPRSLFSNYWTKQGETPPTAATRKIIRPPVRSQSPHCVMRMHHHQQHQQQHQIPDPYKYFGLEEDYKNGEEDDDEYSTNTYERMLNYYEVSSSKNKKNSIRRRPYEPQPLWASWFSASAPSLSNSSSNKFSGGLLASMATGFRSEPVLHTKPLPSVLRKGRFSKGNNNNNKRNGTTTISSTSLHRVRFQAAIQVRSYQPPVESWAADGWSSWFGI